jgi:hypothetical protein
MYHRANRGQDIGGWNVRVFEPGLALLEKGLLAQAFVTCGFPMMVSQSQCMRKGQPTCVFELTSVLLDQRWHGGRSSQFRSIFQ